MKMFFAVLFLFIFCNASMATQNIPLASPIVEQYTHQTKCIQAFPVNSERLFYLTLAAINANNFTPIEAQTRAGYILFSTGHKEFLATIAKTVDNLSVIKITPANNSYYFSPSIVNNLFHYINSNLQAEITSIVEVKE